MREYTKGEGASEWRGPILDNSSAYIFSIRYSCPWAVAMLSGKLDQING